MRPPSHLFVAVALSACASSGGPAARGPASTACWPVVALELQALEHGREWEPVSRLAADGTIANRAGTLGRISGDTLTLGAGGTGAFTGTCSDRLATFGSPVSPAFKIVARYEEGDVFVEEGGHGGRIAVGDDGVVEMTLRDRRDRPVFGRPGSGGGTVRVVGDVRAGRRTAALLVFTTAALGAGR